MGAGGATPTRQTVSRVQPSFAIEAEALEAWLARADKGDELVYATGTVLPWTAAAVTLARSLAADGLIRTHLRKIGDSFEYLAVKRQPDPDALPPVRALASREDDGRGGHERGDDADARVLRALCRAANLGQVCPSNSELAQLCDLRDAVAASYRLRKLVQAGAIRVEDQGPSKRRIVTIVASGQRTVAGAL